MIERNERRAFRGPEGSPGAREKKRRRGGGRSRLWRLPWFWCGLVLLALLPIRAQGAQVGARAAIVVEARTGRVLFAQNEHERLAMASTTKIMTALITLEQEDLDEEFTVDSQAIQVEGSSMGLTEGDTVTLRTLAYGMLLPSGNDAANAAAVRIAGSQNAFVERMNRRAGQMGLADTAFVTPSGLDAQGHYSTAYDMAMLAREALQNPDFAEICGQYRATREYGNPPYTRWLKNHNRLLEEYEGTIGVKTGFTGDAGRCLVSAAERDGVRLICVTLNCPDDWRTHAQLLDDGFAQVHAQELPVPSTRVPVGGGSREAVAARPQGSLTVPLREGELARVKAQVRTEPFLLAPVRAGQAVGEICFTLDGEELLTVPLCAEREVPERPSEKGPGLWERLFGVKK